MTYKAKVAVCSQINTIKTIGFNKNWHF